MLDVGLVLIKGCKKKKGLTKSVYGIWSILANDLRVT
jgi:hypothetical protein